MTEITTAPAAAEQARVLLASAASPENFRNRYTYCDDVVRVLDREAAATAAYETQAATAHALLAVAGELARLRAEVRKVAEIGSAVVDVANAVRDQSATIAQVGAEAAAQVVDLRDVFDAGLAGLDDTLKDMAAEVAELTGELVEHRLEGHVRPLGWLARWRARRRARAEYDAMIDAAVLTNRLGDTLTRAAELLEGEGWDAWGMGGRDVMAAVSRVTKADQELCTRAWHAIVAHLDQPLTEWQRESGRTRAEVVAMLRQVTAQVVGSDSDPELEVARERAS
ncbi:hypothetical protein [Nonomuraea typhae]|uniref:Chemotaxis protein n=1 Tax=Nonomuraea typhae TaxID=2603600 RepID=A0ABW7Z6Q6_9ACTN